MWYRIARFMGERERGVSPVIGTVMMVSVVVILASVASVVVFDLGGGQQSPAPPVAVEHEVVADGGDPVIAITLRSGEAVRTDRLYTGGSTPMDIGGSPSSSTPANDAYASDRETFTESSGSNPPQVGIGETWEAGETVYLDPTGSVEGTTVRIYWNTEPVEGINPGTVTGEDSYRVVTFSV